MNENFLEGLKVLREEDETCVSGGGARAFGEADAFGFDPKDAEARTSVFVRAYDDGIRYALSRSSASIVLV